MAKGAAPRPAATDPAFGVLADTMALGMAYQMLASPDGAQRRFVYVSDSCLALNGVPAAAAIADANALYELIAPEHRERMAEAEQEALANHSSFDIEVLFRRPDGELRWNRIASAPRPKPWPDGWILWDGIQIDITEKKRIELELAEQRRRLDLAVEATGLGFWEWDREAGRLTWSDRNRELFGVPPGAEIDLRRYMEIVHPDDRDLVRKAYRAQRDRPQGGDFSMEYRIVRPDRTVRWILAHARVVASEAGPRLVVGTSQDVTERKRAEERQTLLNRELAHRAKNGMTVLATIANQTARSAKTVEEFTELFGARLHALAHSQDLITEGGGRFLHLSDLVHKVLEPFGLGRFDIDPALSEVELTGETGFGSALLFHEMATNAVKYGALSKETGRVSITARTNGRLAEVEWRERGGPPAVEASSKGFGMRLMQSALKPQGGEVEPHFAPEGFSALMRIPLARAQ